MKYLAIDIETTSIKPEDGQILSFAAVLEDTSSIKPIKELPSFYCVFRYSKIKGEPYALNMNKGLIEKISEDKDLDLFNIDNFNSRFNTFLLGNGLSHLNKGNFTSVLPPYKKVKLQAAGKNISSFDIPWIVNKIPGFSDYFQFNHRSLDVGSVMVDFKNDHWIPNLLECKKRAGVKGEVTHNALEDCYDVIEVLRSKYYHD
tara:strand:+ start:19146 stop:19751 length:606 start_codon:yes stop_codon:yes gene_type:complete